MSTVRTLALALSLILPAAPAFAKDLCFTDTFGSVFVIHKAKKLYGVFVHNLIQGKDQSVGALTDATASAPTHYDSDGDGTANYSDQWTSIDCKTVVIPPIP
jgi:hypothetical protein